MVGHGVTTFILWYPETVMAKSSTVYHQLITHGLPEGNIITNVLLLLLVVLRHHIIRKADNITIYDLIIVGLAEKALQIVTCRYPLFMHR